MLEIFTLFAVLIIVQTVYATVVRPRAEAIRAADLERMQNSLDFFGPEQDDEAAFDIF